MYKLICQLFIAVIGQNLPEEIFDETLYWFLQGSRKSRKIIDRNMKQFSLMTPYQLEISGWPSEYIEGYTKKGRLKVHSILICQKFRQMFHTFENENHSPCHRYIKTWDENKQKKIRVILYFTSAKDKEITKMLINQNGGFRNVYNDLILNYKLEAVDKSHMSSCYFCSKFMPCLSERLHINDKSSEIFDEMRHMHSSISYKNDWNQKLCEIPICEECLCSKERQEKYRKNMFHYESFKNDRNSNVHSSEWRITVNLEQSLDLEKPDMTKIPYYENFTRKTPFDYSASYMMLIDKYSVFYWHPELTADEYMRLQEYKLQGILGADPLDDDLYPEDDYSDDGWEDLVV